MSCVCTLFDTDLYVILMHVFAILIHVFAILMHVFAILMHVFNKGKGWLYCVFA